MRLKIVTLLFVAAYLHPTAARADCEAYWLRLQGKDEQQVLRLPSGFPLTKFAESQPTWEPDIYDPNGRYVGRAAPTTLEWDPLTQPATIQLVGRLAGKRIYVARYSQRSLALLTEQGSSFCPTLILDADGDFAVVAITGEPEIFRWQNRDLLSVRLYIEGNGAQQEALFFTMAGGQVVHLDVQFPPENAIPADWKPSLHGGGFRRHSLVWETTTWGGGPKQGIIRQRFRIRGRRVELESTSLIPAELPLDSPDDCDPYYELRH